MGVVALSSIAQGIAGLVQEGGIGFVGSALVALPTCFPDFLRPRDRAEILYQVM